MRNPRTNWTREERERATCLLEEGCSYRETAEILTVEFGHIRSKDSVRKQVRTGKVSPNLVHYEILKKDKRTSKLPVDSFDLQQNYGVIDTTFSDKKAPTLEDLFKKFNINKDDWNVLTFKVNQWDVSAKEEIDGKIVWNTHTNYQAKAVIVKKKPTECEFPAVQGASTKPVKLKVKPVIRNNKVDIVVPDSQIGFKRNLDTNELEPLHDNKALAIVTQAIKDIRPDRVVLLGDMLDLPDWSTHFLISPEFSFTTQASIDFLASWLEEMRPYCKEMIYIEGNHEKRMIVSIIKNTMQAYGIKPANQPKSAPVLSIPFLLGLDKLDVQYIGNYPAGEFYINNNLVCIHGHKVGAKSGQSVTKLLEDARISTITGHIHRLEMAHKTIWTQGKPKIYQAVTLGTIARIDGIVPSGSARHNWQQGFGVVEYDDENFQIDTIGIYNGRAIYRGNIYESKGE